MALCVSRSKTIFAGILVTHTVHRRSAFKLLASFTGRRDAVDPPGVERYGRLVIAETLRVRQRNESEQSPLLCDASIVDIYKSLYNYPCLRSRLSG